MATVEGDKKRKPPTPSAIFTLPGMLQLEKKRNKNKGPTYLFLIMHDWSLTAQSCACLQKLVPSCLTRSYVALLHYTGSVLLKSITMWLEIPVITLWLII